MEPNRIDDELKKLPQDARRQIFDFIDFIKARRQKPIAIKQSKKKSSLTDEPFIGIWKSRNDIKDSSSWVRKIRKSEWIEPDA